MHAEIIKWASDNDQDKYSITCCYLSGTGCFDDPPPSRVFAAAQREFAASVDASLERIARDAGVAIGTLYRHFPTRLDLISAAFEPRLQEFLDGASKLTGD